MKVSLYARVSTDDKDQDPERQLIKCRQYAELHNHQVMGEFQEYHTGDSDPMKRPESAKAMQWDAIVIYSMDRLTRQHPVKVIRLVQTLKDRGIKVISVTEPAFNMEHEFGEVLLYLISWFNNYFLTKLKRDIRSGLDRAVAQGKILGAPKKKFNKFRARQMMADGIPLRQIGKDLGVSPATLSRFRKVCEKNPDLYIKEEDVSESSDYGTQDGEKK